MTYRGHLTRAEIGLRPPESRSTNIQPSTGGTTGHHAGKAQNVDPAPAGHSRCLALWRGYQTYHMETHGWVDIAYSFGFCQHGYTLAGRGAGVRTAANGTDDGNSHWYAGCWIGGGSEKPTRDAVDAWWAGVRMMREQGGAGPGANKHSDHKPTTCPGNLGPIIDAGEPSMADDHELSRMPEWGQKFWDRFVRDRITTVPDSWKRPVWRIDLAWLYSVAIVPLIDKVASLTAAVKRLETRVTNLENAPGSGAGLTEAQVRALAVDAVRDELND